MNDADLTPRVLYRYGRYIVSRSAARVGRLLPSRGVVTMAAIAASLSTVAGSPPLAAAGISALSFVVLEALVRVDKAATRRAAKRQAEADAGKVKRAIGLDGRPTSVVVDAAKVKRAIGLDGKPTSVVVDRHAPGGGYYADPMRCEIICGRCIRPLAGTPTERAAHLAKCSGLPVQE